MPYANNHGIRIHYDVEGEGSPLVLQHGITWSARRWYQLGYVDALRADYRVILVDARGHGASDKPHDRTMYQLPLYVSDVVAVLDDLDLDRAHYWGYSMGGWIGFGMAKYAPERVDSRVIGGSHPYEVRVPPSNRLDGSDPQAFLEALYGRIGVDLAKLSSEARDQLLANDFRALAAALQDRPSLEDVLPAMRMPCLLYVGEADPVCPRVRECVRHMPNALFLSLKNLDHGAAFREAQLVLPHVTRFYGEMPASNKARR